MKEEKGGDVLEVVFALSKASFFKRTKKVKFVRFGFKFSEVIKGCMEKVMILLYFMTRHIS
jgi:hypothetical protein